jgi:hypothetical protein
LGVAVYPRLNDLLRARNLTVAELQRQIEQRYGLDVDPKTLYRLSHAEPVQRADLQIAGAAAAVLGVDLGNLFRVEATPVATSAEAEALDLGPDQSQRLADLFALQAQGTLSDEARAELEALVAEYGRLLHERRLREIAQQRGISVSEARHDVEESLAGALAWWEKFHAEPGQRARVVGQAKRRSAQVAD